MKSLLTKIIIVLVIGALTVSLCACEKTATSNENCDSGHLFVDHSYTSPTCKTNGEKVQKCSRCGFENKTTLLTIDHDWVVKSTTPSTCTIKGSQTLECSMCHETKNEQLQLAEHDYELIRTTDSTCVAHGYKHYQCKDCTEAYSEDLPLAGHTYKTETKEATCFTHGGTFEKCSVCADEKPVNETPLLAHEFGTDGYCAKCGIYKTLFDENALNVSWSGTPIGTIRGSLPTKFKDNNDSVSDNYWKNHTVTLTLSLYDTDGKLLETHSFRSTTIPFKGANYGKLTIQYLRASGEIGDFKANEFAVTVGEGNKYSLESRQDCKSFKVELSCDGYEKIEKTYEITEAQ